MGLNKATQELLLDFKDIVNLLALSDMSPM